MGLQCRHPTNRYDRLGLLWSWLLCSSIIYKWTDTDYRRANKHCYAHGNEHFPPPHYNDSLFSRILPRPLKNERQQLFGNAKRQWTVTSHYTLQTCRPTASYPKNKHEGESQLPYRHSPKESWQITVCTLLWIEQLNENNNAVNCSY